MSNVVEVAVDSKVVEVSSDLKVVEIIGGGTITIDGGGGGTTNLDYTASTTNGIVTSSTGTDATIPLVSTNAGLMSPSDKTKLDGIAAGATANSSDATLLNRSNHTGTQSAGTITGLATVATTGAYNDLTGKPTIPTLTSQLTNDSGFLTTNAVSSVAGKTGVVTLNSSDVGLGNVDNTSDTNKPISTATQTALNAKENTITAGTTSQYYRGDKTFQTLDKSAVGLGNVDNTSDANKPVSTATQTALNAKQNTLVSGTNIKTINTQSILGSGDITIGGSATWGSITGTLSTQTDLQTALNGKQNTITTGTISQYFRGDLSLATLDKTAVGLGNVSNVDTTTTANITDSSNKRFITDAQQTVLGNTSGTNTGDNTTNTTSNTYADGKVADAITDGVTTIAPSQNAVFDALAGKQANLQSGTNIKTINGDSILGSGNLVITGGSGITNAQSIVNALIFG